MMVEKKSLGKKGLKKSKKVLVSKKNSVKIKKSVMKNKKLPTIKPVKIKRPVMVQKKVIKKAVKKTGKVLKKDKKGFFGRLSENIFGKGNAQGNLKLNGSVGGKKEQIKKLDKVSKKLRTEISQKHIEHVKKHFKKLDESKEKHSEEKKGKGHIQTGVGGFDALFDKNMGIPSGASVLIEGGPGSGKTLFCLNTVYNLCRQGKKCLYMSFEEPEENLISHMENFNWKVRDFVKKDKLRITRFDAIDVSRSIEALLSAAKKELMIEVDPVFFPEDFDPDFVIIDSLTSIASAFSGEESRFRIYMEQLFRYLESHNITNFLIREVSSPSHVGTTFKEQGEAVSFLSDGIIIIYNVIYDSGERGSAIEVLKMRGANFKKRIVDMKIINGKGLEIYSNKILNKVKGKGFNLT